MFRPATTVPVSARKENQSVKANSDCTMNSQVLTSRCGPVAPPAARTAWTDALFSVWVLPRKRSLPVKTHLVTLSFDDGSQKSWTRTAEIFEQFKLSACLK